MRTQITENTVKLWLSSKDTYHWAKRWPCSKISDKRLFAEFDRGGLIDVAIDGKSDCDVQSEEFNAITSDFIETKLSKDHPAWFVVVGQFKAVTA